MPEGVESFLLLTGLRMSLFPYLFTMKTIISMMLILLTISCAKKDSAFRGRPIPTSPPVVSTCAEGYIMVPSLYGFNTKAFCVGKYEAAKSDGKALSSMGNLPSSVRLRSEAMALCQANGPKYSLPTNAQWQAIARSIESNPRNWTTNVVGTGALSLGHSDGDPAQALAAGPDSDGCLNNKDTDCSPTAWHFQKRTHLLSNGEVIWDFAGNIAEWVSDVPNIDLTALNGTTVEVRTVTRDDIKRTYGANLVDISKLEDQLAGGFGSLTVDAPRAGVAMGVVRGGGFDSMIESGVFAARVNVPAETAQYDSTPLSVGFRCAYEL
jgi:hypothetical protein